MAYADDSDFTQGVLGGSVPLVECESDVPLQGYAYGPERALLAAILFDGIHACISYILTAASRRRSQFAEGYYWVMARESEYPFSFENVCDALGINPNYLRHGLLQASPAKLERVVRCRRLS
jgi:hypothetical protein